VGSAGQHLLATEDTLRCLDDVATYFKTPYYFAGHTCTKCSTRTFERSAHLRGSGVAAAAAIATGADLVAGVGLRAQVAQQAGVLL